MHHPWTGYVSITIGMVLVVLSVMVLGAIASGWSPEISFAPNEPECALLAGEC